MAQEAIKILLAARINAIMQGLQDPRLQPQELVWNRRIPDVPAVDEEITARFIGTPLTADLIADDAKAAVYAHGKFQFETTRVPNLKIGIGMNQSTLAQVDRIRNGYASPADRTFFEGWENRIMEDLRNAIERRKEVLKVAMLLDGYNYDKMGIKLQNVSWGMPSDLKVTPSVAWTSTSATPITDINTVRRLARIRYGIELNRVTMSTVAFEYVTKTTEFINLAKTFGFGMFNGVPAPAIPLQPDSMLRQILERVIGEGVTIEFYDARYWTQDSTGLTTNQPYLPINKVLLTDSRNDGNRSSMDFANANTIEGMVANMVQVPAIGALPTGPGPISYATLTAPDLNSPGITYWGVARGFPRKHLLQSSAVLTVGAMTDSISTAIPFPA